MIYFIEGSRWYLVNWEFLSFFDSLCSSHPFHSGGFAQCVLIENSVILIVVCFRWYFFELMTHFSREEVFEILYENRVHSERVKMIIIVNCISWFAEKNRFWSWEVNSCKNCIWTRVVALLDTKNSCKKLIKQKDFPLYQDKFQKMFILKIISLSEIISWWMNIHISISAFCVILEKSFTFCSSKVWE